MTASSALSTCPYLYLLTAADASSIPLHRQAGDRLAIMATSPSSQDAFLLQLPLELLQRIIDLLSDETTIMLRLSCKVLQATTFDVFARVHFTKRKICIADKARWTQLSSILDSCLATRLKKLTFTIINDRTKSFQLAPGREFSDMSAAQSHEEAHVTDPSVEACGQISAYQIGCVSNQIKQNLSGLAVKLDFEDYTTSDSFDPIYPTSAGVFCRLLHYTS